MFEDLADSPMADRRTRILDAAERCFVRAGFHRTTMQDVAAEAGMSPGNLYRYFPSKDAIVAGLVERDRAMVMADFADLDGVDDFVEVFARLGRKYFAEEPRERSILCLEIWAEATRSQAIAQMSREFDREFLGRMTELFRHAQARGAISDTIDPAALATIISILADGLFVRRAVAPGFDPVREVGYVMAVIEAAFAGRIDARPRPAEAPSTEGRG